MSDTTENVTYSITPQGGLIGDRLLGELFAAGFRVQLYEADGLSNAGLEALDGEGGVPPVHLLWEFSIHQPRYAKELRLRQPLLKKRRGRGK